MVLRGEGMGAAGVFVVALLLMQFACSNPIETTPTPCPQGMAFVQGGSFFTGADISEMDIAPMAHGLGFLPHSITLAFGDDFCMDRYEYPNQPGTRPKASVRLSEAKRSCKAIGKRLCREMEFERACGGPWGWHAPYGSDDWPGVCNNDAIEDVGDAERWLATSGAFSDCVSPEGIYDLEGNLSEWVEEDLARDHQMLTSGHNKATDRLLAHRPEAVVRGGTMWVGIYGSGCQARHLHVAEGPTSPDDGFRCCMDVPEPVKRQP